MTKNIDISQITLAEWFQLIDRFAEPICMKPLPHTPELEAVARNTVWFMPPAEAIADSFHFIAHVLTYGVYEDVSILRKYISDEDLKGSDRSRSLPACSIRDPGRTGI